MSVLKLDVSVRASLVRHCREAMPSACYFAYIVDGLDANTVIGVRDGVVGDVDVCDIVVVTSSDGAN